MFALRPAVTEEEGKEVEVPAGFDASRWRLTGNVTGQPPFHGWLVHPGWEATVLRVAHLVGQHRGGADRRPGRSGIKMMTDAAATKTLILGLGNPLVTDDSVGLRVVEATEAAAGRSAATSRSPRTTGAGCG